MGESGRAWGDGAGISTLPGGLRSVGEGMVLVVGREGGERVSGGG